MHMWLWQEIQEVLWRLTLTRPADAEEGEALIRIVRQGRGRYNEPFKLYKPFQIPKWNRSDENHDCR